ncbi:MAG: AAA family ATPase [Lachnospiraceae bacterium]|nr:AAA family ATPase [Lachnospiraceae bacterium]
MEKREQRTNRKQAVVSERDIPWYDEDYRGPAMRNSRVKDYLSLTPQDIKAELEKSVVNQEEACRRVAVMMYQHLHGHRFVGMLAGPTGSGKSFIAESLKEIFPDVVYIRDVSNVTCDGWKGNKKVGTLFKGVHPPYSCSGRIYPVLFLDECDKMFSPKTSSGEENVSESVQYEFLSAIHGGEVEVAEAGNGRPTSRTDTSRMSFLFAGAFEKKAGEIAARESGASIGFGADHTKPASYDRELTMEDVHEAGCISELCGRIQRIIPLNRIDESGFRSMLDIRDRGPVYELEREFRLPIRISDARKDEIAHNAFATGLGIRGMKNSIRTYIDELTWEDCNAGKLDIM